MTTRDDITVFYHFSPRLILVAKPSSEVTMQDLHDTLMDIDDEPANMIYPHLVQSAGKEDLGGGVSVGITLTLRNAQIAFERRENVVTQGTITSNSTTGKVTQQVIDTSATFETDGVERGMLVSNSTDVHASEVIEVISQTELLVLSPGAGLTGDFTIGDNYQIWETETCNFTGGNLVATDYDGNTIEALFPTYCVTAKLTASSAATLQNTAQLEYGTFDGGVHVNLSSAYSGTAYPVGTPPQPVNNFSDALTIAQTRGFTRLYIKSSCTIGSGLDFSGLELIGESPNKTTFTISDAANVTNCEFSNATIQGTLDGGNVLQDCSLLTITYVEGIIERCLLLETITLSGNATAFFLDCWSGVPGSQTPTINMGGSGSELAIRNYSGGIKLTNRNGTDPCSIDMNSGQIIIDDTVTNGTITLRGVAKWANEETYAGGANIQSELITFQDTQQLAFEDGSVNIDVDNGFTGTAYPRGTSRMPVNNIEDALIIASGNLLDKMHIMGNLVVSSGVDVSNLLLQGHSANNAILTLEEGSTSTNSSFSDFTLSGYLTGNNIIRDSIVQDTNNFDGVMHQIMLAGTVNCSEDSANFLSCYQAPDFLGSGIINPNNCNGCNIQDWSGLLYVGNKTSTSETNVTLNGNIHIFDTAASGTIHMHGTGSWYNRDTYAGGSTILDHLISTDLIQDMAGTIITGYAVSSTINSITLASDASTTNGTYDPATITIMEGTGAGQSRMVYQYTGSSQTAYVDRNWKVLPDTTSKYIVQANPGREHVNEGMAQGGTSTSMTLNANASDYDNAYEGQVIFVRSGTGEDQARYIQSYDGTTKVASIRRPWAVVPSSDSSYVMLPTYIPDIARANVIQVSGEYVSINDFVGESASLTTDNIANAVWDQVMDAGYTAEETMKIMVSALAGKLSGAAGTTITIRDVNDTKDRIVATVTEDGNRTNVVIDAS